MKLTSEHLQELLNIAISAAQKAGTIISSYSNSKVEVKSKAAGSSLASQVVTEVDIKCQDIILSEIGESIKKYHLGLLTEESPDNNSRFEKDYFWCIDPLDGTLPFTEKQAGYAVSIGLLSKTGEPHLGVIYDPLTRVFYYAVKGKGAFKNNKKWEYAIDKNTFYLVCDRSFTKYEHFARYEKKLKDFCSKNGIENFKVISQGGAAMNAMWVIENAPACYFKLPKPKQGGGSLWDYAASACIFNELGVTVTNMQGNKLDLNRHDSAFMNHEGIFYTSTEKAKILLKEILQED